MKTRVAIYGAGGFAREVAWLISTRKDAFDFVGYIEDKSPEGRVLNGMPVRSWEGFCESDQESLISIGVGDPRARQKLADRCGAAGYSFANLVHRGVEMSDSVERGAGSIICAGCALTVNIRVGRHVHINLLSTVGHDAVIGDFTTISPGVCISGNVHIGTGVFIGTGATIINGTAAQPLVIGDRAVVAAGACVTTSLEADSLYAGVPAILKKRYVVDG